jgi:hypothetical protein
MPAGIIAVRRNDQISDFMTDRDRSEGEHFNPGRVKVPSPPALTPSSGEILSSARRTTLWPLP